LHILPEKPKTIPKTGGCAILFFQKSAKPLFFKYLAMAKEFKGLFPMMLTSPA